MENKLLEHEIRISTLEEKLNVLEERLESIGSMPNFIGGGIPVSDDQQPPWQFSCTVENNQRTGGWMNCILQLGYNFFLASLDVVSARSGVTSQYGIITGTNLTDDGDYVCEVDIARMTAAIMLKANIANTYPIDFEKNIVYIDIGTVANGVQVSGIPNHPVIYTYQ